MNSYEFTYLYIVVAYSDLCNYKHNYYVFINVSKNLLNFVCILRPLLIVMHYTSIVVMYNGLLFTWRAMNIKILIPPTSVPRLTKMSKSAEEASFRPALRGKWQQSPQTMQTIPPAAARVEMEQEEPERSRPT